jgi:hypothetical protein
MSAETSVTDWQAQRADSSTPTVSQLGSIPASLKPLNLTAISCNHIFPEFRGLVDVKIDYNNKERNKARNKTGKFDVSR